ncbi:MAG: glutamate--tRNA ligase [Prevotella sp.]|nr:glutamate--tRNA ligase [Prevotella sp.]
MTERRVRVRFAPSPTGPLHIGGVRTALYNYLFARQHGGDLVFRIEDTDSTRFVPGAEQYIIEAFQWLGIKFDEGVSFGGQYGPYRQSERRDIYKKYGGQLLAEGKAYIAFDTPEELEQKRQEIQNFQYDSSTRGGMRNSLTMAKEEVDSLIAEGRQYVVRFKIDPGQEVLVDDHLMEISHVIRGEEWLPSAPLHVLLYQAFGWQDTMPRFAHLPLLLKPVGNGKLSKRDGDKLGFPVFPLEWHDPKTGEVSTGYREKGYLPEAVVNFLALLGWSPGNDQELMTMDEMVSLFDLTKCSKAGAKFDYVKAAWFNHQYLIRRPDADWCPTFDKVLKDNGITATAEQEAEVVRMMKMKVVEYTDSLGNKKKRNISFPSDLWPLTKFFFVAPTDFDREGDKFIRKNWNEQTADQMRQLADVLESVTDWSVEGQKAVVDPWVAQTGIKPWNAWRIALVGTGQGPDMYELSTFLGKEETIKRTRKAIEKLG